MTQKFTPIKSAKSKKLNKLNIFRYGEFNVETKVQHTYSENQKTLEEEVDSMTFNSPI